MQKDLTSLSALNWDDLKFFLEVARTRKASSAAKRLSVDYTTVSRRISSLEGALGTLLFEKSRTNGFVLTAEGQRLLGYAESIESTLHMACEQVSGSGVALSGHVRMGCTEGFGSFFITPQLSHFVDAYPAISVDILPLPHFISLSKREADIVIALERPEHGPYVCCKLCDYRLRLYATRDYLDNHEPILRSSDLPFLRALIPVMLDGAVNAEQMPLAIDGTLQSLDNSLAHLSPEMLKLTRQLFDVLGMAVTRGPLTGIWGSWENASGDDVRNFLGRWQNSSLSLLRMGHNSIVQLVMMAWYNRAESWAHCGYPGPPKV